jgi:uncharacterized protein (TIGR02001 family)
MKQIVLAFLLLAGITVAHAELTGNASLTTDYRFRGISQTQNGSALQGGVDYTHASGFYAGNWNSNVSSLAYTDSNGLESDVYAGFKKEVIKGVTVDVGSYNYIYSRAGGKFNSNSNTNEAYVGVEVGPISVKYSQSLGDYFGIAKSSNSKYVQADIKYPVAKNITADAHYGQTMITGNGKNDYTDINVGGTYALSKGFSVGAHYYTNSSFGSTAKATNTISGQKLYKDAVVVSLSKSF